jgi:hypothetical protein
MASRATSASVDVWVDGSAAKSKSAGASVVGTTLALSGTAATTEWAIYELAGFESAIQLQQLRVDFANMSTGGSHPGYWVALANYSRDRWDMLGLYTGLSFTRALNGSGAYLSGGGKVYVAVLIDGAQSVTVSRAGLTISDAPWQQLELAAGPSNGVTPTIDFTPGRNPGVAWANSSNGQVSFAICDRSLGFAIASSWTVSVAEDDPATASQQDDVDPVSPNAKAQWLDLIIDPDCSLPRISMLYNNLAGARGNSRVGCTALGDIDGTLHWLNWRMAFTDTAYWTSIARDPSDASYAIAYTAGNQNRTGAPDNRQINDMELRTISWLTPVSEGQMSTAPGAGQLIYGFGQGWIYPHLRYRDTGFASVAFNGGLAWAQQNATTWAPFLSDSASGDIGSLAFAPDFSPGTAYCYTGTSGQQELRYVDFDANFNGTPQTVESQALGLSNGIAECSQLGYLPDGRACIAYTLRTASGVAVKFALQQAGGTWKIETVSQTNSTPSNPTAPVYVDLAVDSQGVPAVCWTQRAGNATSLVVALRGT